MTIALLGTFTLAINASNKLDKASTENSESAVRCQEHVSVDCDGDGRIDYDHTVNCEFAEALKKQYENSCG